MTTEPSSRTQTKFSDSRVTVAKEMAVDGTPKLVSWTCSENTMGLSAMAGAVASNTAAAGGSGDRRGRGWGEMVGRGLAWEEAVRGVCAHPAAAVVCTAVRAGGPASHTGPVRRVSAMLHVAAGVPLGGARAEWRTTHLKLRRLRCSTPMPPQGAGAEPQLPTVALASTSVLTFDTRGATLSSRLSEGFGL